MLKEIAAVIGWLLSAGEAYGKLARGGTYALAGLSLVFLCLRAWQGSQATRHGQLYQIAVPQGADIQPFKAEQMFAALRGLRESWWRRLLRGPEHIALEIAGDATGIRFFLWAPARVAENVVRSVQSCYEQADIRELTQDYLTGPGPDAFGQPHQFPALRPTRLPFRAARLQLLRTVALPIKTLKEFEKTDPLGGITAAMAGLQEGEGVLVQLLIQPGGDGTLAGQARRETARIERGRSLAQASPDGRIVARVVRDYTADEQQQVKSIGGKRAKLCFRVALRLCAVSQSGRAAAQRLEGLAAAYEQFNVATLNGWRRRNVWFCPHRLFLPHLQRRVFPLWGRRKGHHPLVGEHDVVTIEELSSLWHLPHPLVVETPGILWSLSRKRAAAAQFVDAKPEDGIVLARTTYQDEQKDVILPLNALYLHLGVLGKHGSGKSTLLARLVLGCIERKISVILLDPHGDLCEDLLPRIPAVHRGRVIYFNPYGDQDQPMGLSLLEPEPGQRPAKACNDTVEMLMHLFGRDLVGPRSAYLLRNALRVLLEIGEMTLLEVEDLLQPANEDFRRSAILWARSRTTRKFMVGYVQSMIKRNIREYTASINPVLNKIGAFSSDPCLAHVIGQARSSFLVREVLDSGSVLLCNLASGQLGVDNARLLAGAIASRVVQAGLARANVPPDQRYPAVLVADEVGTYATPSFAEAVAQLRKFRVGMVLATQVLSQLDEVPSLRQAFLSTETLCTFRVIAEDAVKIATEMTGFFAADDLQRLDAHQVVIRMASQRTTLPFSAATIPLHEGAPPDPLGAAEIRLRSREVYGRPLDEVEAAMAARAEFYETRPAPPEPDEEAEELRRYNAPQI